MSVQNMVKWIRCVRDVYCFLTTGNGVENANNLLLLVLLVALVVETSVSRAILATSRMKRLL